LLARLTNKQKGPTITSLHEATNTPCIQFSNQTATPDQPSLNLLLLDDTSRAFKPTMHNFVQAGSYDNAAQPQARLISGKTAAGCTVQHLLLTLFLNSLIKRGAQALSTFSPVVLLLSQQWFYY
jgi:hypothetical protein